MMISKKCVIKVAVSDLTIFVLKWLKKMKVNIVFSKKVKTPILNVFAKLKLFSSLNVVSDEKYRRFERFRRTSCIKKSS